MLAGAMARIYILSQTYILYYAFLHLSRIFFILGFAFPPAKKKAPAYDPQYPACVFLPFLLYFDVNVKDIPMLRHVVTSDSSRPPLC